MPCPRNGFLQQNTRETMCCTFGVVKLPVLSFFALQFLLLALQGIQSVLQLVVLRVLLHILVLLMLQSQPQLIILLIPAPDFFSHKSAPHTSQHCGADAALHTWRGRPRLRISRVLLAPPAQFEDLEQDSSTMIRRTNTLIFAASHVHNRRNS
jgi:hypothetical protein